MPSFFERLQARVQEANSMLCVGLDPRARNAEEAGEQCLHVIQSTHRYAAAFKVNSAFFEVFGGEGIAALREVIASVPREVPVILDAKRGDIADTSVAYARAAFETLGAAAITVSPYVGGDGIAPFIADAAHGAFVLCKTSNPGADELQALETTQGAMFEVVARRAQTWNKLDNVGLVVGATDPARLARVREIAPEMWILVPGIGAQGGDLAATVQAGVRQDGMGLIINASRSIASAANPGEAARKMRDEIRNLTPQPSSTEFILRRVEGPGTGSLLNLKGTNSGEGVTKQGGEHGGHEEQLARDLLESNCVRFGEFTLKSGLKSPIYLDLRRLVSHPAILKRVGKAYAALIRGLEYDRIAGIPYAALPIATAASLELDKPMIYPRREVKEYGTRAIIEGEYNAGETVVVLDDLATTGETKFEAIDKLTGAGLQVRDIVVLIDRGQGAGELLAGAGYKLHAVTTLPRLLEIWRTSNAITTEQYDEVKQFLGI